MTSNNNNFKRQTVFKEENEEEKKEVDSEINKTSSGLEQHIAGLLCYLFWFVTGTIFLLIEKENHFVRFHAMQSIIISIAIFVVSLVLTFIPFINLIIGLLLAPVTFILWIVMMYKAYSGERFKLPIVGDFAEQQLNKTAK